MYRDDEDDCEEEEKEEEDEETDRLKAESILLSTVETQSFPKHLSKIWRRRRGCGTLAIFLLSRPRKRRLTKESIEAGAENEFLSRSSYFLYYFVIILFSTFTPISGLKLNFDDYCHLWHRCHQRSGPLKTSTKVLASSSSKVTTLSLPLPQRTQDRLDLVRRPMNNPKKRSLNGQKPWNISFFTLSLAPSLYRFFSLQFKAEQLNFPLQSQFTCRVSNIA